MFYVEAIMGDSGSPCFLLLDGQMTLMNVTWTSPGFNGVMLSDYAGEIQAALDFLAPGANYTLQFVDLHAYPVLEGAMP